MHYLYLMPQIISSLYLIIYLFLHHADGSTVHTINKIYSTRDYKTVQRNYSSTDIANKFHISLLVLLSEHFGDSMP